MAEKKKKKTQGKPPGHHTPPAVSTAAKERDYRPSYSKGSQRDDPLEIYLKEIRKIPLLTQKEEQRWARAFAKHRNEKIRLLKRAVAATHAIQSYKPLSKLFFLKQDSLYEYIHLKESLVFHKKILKIESQLSKTGTTRDKRKLTKEKLKVEQEFTEVLARMNIKELGDWQSVLEHEEIRGKKTGLLKQHLAELHDSWQALTEIEPKLREARQKLIQSNLRLVVSICRHYKSQAVPFRDIVQEGNLGLIKAVEKFDHKKGFRLNTYASWWIRESINRAIEEKSRVIRIPVYVNEKFYKIKKAAKKALQDEGKESTIAEIANQLKIPAQEVTRILTAFKDPVSLETSLLEDIDPLENFLSDNQPTPMENICEEVIKEKATSIIDTLPAREASILKMRFGLGDEGEKTLEEVGEKFSVSRERVRQLENKALRKLRRNKELRTLLSMLSKN